MPYIFERYKLKLPKGKDRRIKMTDEIKTDIRQLYDSGSPIRRIAKKYEGIVSRRLIQLFLFPERAEHAKRLYKERRLDGRYYDKEKQKKAIQKTRLYKRSLCFMIPKDKLEKWSWYRGEGRNANVAMWDGKYFRTYCNYYGEAREKFEDYWDKDSGTFKPFRKI